MSFAERAAPWKQRVSLIVLPGIYWSFPMPDNSDSPSRALAETENYMVWEVSEPDGEITFHVELGAMTLHFFREEWREFLQLTKEAASNT